MRVRPYHTLALLPVLLAVAGCASGPPPMPAATAQASPCPHDLTPACYEYIGKTKRCFCSSRDGLKRILEPDAEYRW